MASSDPPTDAVRLADARVLVLAAGRGTRMGGSKALMEVGGRAWWTIQRDRLAALRIATTWVVSEAVRGAVVAGHGAPERLVVADEAWPMFDSIVAGLRSMLASPPHGVFVLPVDVPAPGLAVWAALNASGVPAAPSFEGRPGHPVFLPWCWAESRIINPGAGALPPERRRLDALLKGEGVTIKVSDSSVTANLNTPDDVRRWLDRVPHGGGGAG